MLWYPYLAYFFAGASLPMAYPTSYMASPDRSSEPLLLSPWVKENHHRW